MVVVRGPAGIGKTRLVEESLSRTRAAAAVGRGYADPGGGAPPLWPWRRAAASAGMEEVTAALAASTDQVHQVEAEAAAARSAG